MVILPLKDLLHYWLKTPEISHFESPSQRIISHLIPIGTLSANSSDIRPQTTDIEKIGSLPTSPNT